VLRTVSPVGSELLVPDSIGEDKPYFTSNELEPACEYYRAQGYVVFRGLVSPALCDRVVRGFQQEARDSRVPILRQKNMQYERNEFDQNGFLSNPIFNIQDLQSKHFNVFKSAALDLYTDPAVTRAVSALLGGPAEGEGVRLIESMYFEAPAGTWPHQDSYYQDSAAQIGGATAAWIALEDITSKAGRFYVCPKTHAQFPVIWNRDKWNSGTGHENYKDAILSVAREHGVSWRAPYLAKGDVLFWNSLTIHGSLPPFPGSSDSRKSLTGHYLRSGHQLFQFHTRVRRQKMKEHNGTQIGLLHDQDEVRNQLVRAFAYHFPNLWTLGRRIAIKFLVNFRQQGAAARNANR
jgi:phytanoyl-CoA hydroxylase